MQPGSSKLPALDLFARRAKSIRLVVFDWDGTLRDSIGSIVACALEALADLGLGADETAIRSTVGLALDESIPHWVDGIGRSAVDAVVERYRIRWVEEWHCRADLFPRVPAMLEELAGGELLLAVATGKSRQGLLRDFEKAQVGRYFHGTRTPDEAAAKPSPDMLFQLMEELGARPEETLMVGDTTHDLEMAQSARVGPLGVLGGAMSRTQLECLALDCLESITDLPAWLRLRDGVV